MSCGSDTYDYRLSLTAMCNWMCFYSEMTLSDSLVDLYWSVKCQVKRLWCSCTVMISLSGVWHCVLLLIQCVVGGLASAGDRWLVSSDHLHRAHPTTASYQISRSSSGSQHACLCVCLSVCVSVCVVLLSAQSAVIVLSVKWIPWSTHQCSFCHLFNNHTCWTARAWVDVMQCVNSERVCDNSSVASVDECIACRTLHNIVLVIYSS